MKALLGFLQVGLVIGGIIAALNGQWVLLIVSLAGAFAIGWLGNRATRAVEGISESGRDAVAMLYAAEQHIRDGDYRAAVGSARGAVNGLRLGGDKDFLPFAYSTLGVALAATGDIEGSRRALNDVDACARNVRPDLRDDANDLCTLGHELRRELDRRPFDPDRVLKAYSRWNEV
jgi:hypothetical protein